MLKKLRKKKTAKRIWIILTILILPAFLFWGFGSFMRSNKEADYAGRISGKRVSSLEYKDALNAVRNQAIIQFGDNLSQIENKLNLGAMAWDRLVLLTQAKKQKILVTDQEVIQLIRNYPFFQRKGQFDNELYSQMLRYVFRTQPRIFEEQTRQSLALSKLYTEVTQSLSLIEDEIKKEYLRQNAQTSLYYIAAIPSDFIKDITASEEVIKSYFLKNSAQFKEPPSFNIEYVSLALEDKNEAAIKDKIKGLVLRLKKKENFAKAAGELKLEVKETGPFSQIGPIPGIGWSPQILSLISNLKVGEFTVPIYMDKYYYVLRLKEKKEPYIPDFQTIKDKVKEVFIKEATREIARKNIEDCLNELNAAYKTNPKSVDFTRIAKAYGLKTDSTGLFKYGSYIEGIGASDNFFIAGQDLKEDGYSGIIEMPSGLYIIRLKSRISVDEKKFLAEKQEFSKKLLLQKKAEHFGRFLEDLKRNAQLF